MSGEKSYDKSFWRTFKNNSVTKNSSKKIIRETTAVRDHTFFFRVMNFQRVSKPNEGQLHVKSHNSQLKFFTARIWRMGEGAVFTGVCLFTSGEYPILAKVGTRLTKVGTPRWVGYPATSQGGYPGQGRYPPSQGGYPPVKVGTPQPRWGTPWPRWVPPSQGGYPLAKVGTPPSQGGVLPSAKVGTTPRTWYTVGGISLAFT